MSPSETDSVHENDDSVAPDPRLTKLIAYLDGELPADESEVMERELAAEPALRQAADSLDRTWQMLGALEEASASGEFTKKTLSSIRTISTADTPQSLPTGKTPSPAQTAGCSTCPAALDLRWICRQQHRTSARKKCTHSHNPG